jgi:hypothetical protein
VRAARVNIEQVADEINAKLASWLEARWVIKSSTLQKSEIDLEHDRAWPVDKAHEEKSS